MARGSLFCLRVSSTRASSKSICIYFFCPGMRVISFLCRSSMYVSCSIGSAPSGPGTLVSISIVIFIPSSCDIKAVARASCSAGVSPTPEPVVRMVIWYIYALTCWRRVRTSAKATLDCVPVHRNRPMTPAMTTAAAIASLANGLFMIDLPFTINVSGFFACSCWTQSMSRKTCSSAWGPMPSLASRKSFLMWSADRIVVPHSQAETAVVPWRSDIGLWRCSAARAAPPRSGGSSCPSPCEG